MPKTSPEKLAAALRANLKKRKTTARTVPEKPGNTPETPATPPPDQSFPTPPSKSQP